MTLKDTDDQIGVLAIGDFEFKLPRVYTERVFLNAVPGFRMSMSVLGWLDRNQTPPYMSSDADVQYLDLQRHREAREEVVLLLASDGLIDLDDPEEKRATEGDVDLDILAKKWMEAINTHAEEENLALRILRSGLGGEDTEMVSSFLTLDGEERWIDDTTILVQKLV